MDYDENYYNGGRGAYLKNRYVYSLAWKRRAGSLMAEFPGARTFLDVGCAKGYLLRGYVEQGVSVENVYGFDISEWAIENAEPLIKSRVMCCSVFDFIPFQQWNLVTAFDLLEHIPKSQLKRAISVIESCSSHYLNVMLMTDKANWDTDVTHVSIMSLDEWLKFFTFRVLGTFVLPKSPHVTVASLVRQ